MRRACARFSNSSVVRLLRADGVRKKFGIACIAASIGAALMAPAHASLLTYEVSGTFADGGIFGGTFGYDPTTNSYTDVSLGDQFTISTSAGSQGQGVFYTPFQSPLYYSDENSSATQFYIFGGFSGPSGGEQSTLMLDWKTPLNASGGGNLQSITGGSEEFTIATLSGNCAPAAYCVTTLDNRQVASGYVELVQPVPLPTSAWLLLSTLGGLGVFGKCRSRHSRVVSSIPRR
jgi:hypothetical protein